MCIVINTEIFVGRAKAIYGDFFDFGKTVYEHARRHVIVTCPVHGDFSVRPKQFLKGSGCLLCARSAEGVKRRADKALTFAERSSKVNGGKYLYHLVEYINSSTNVDIVCTKHGVFSQVPSDHLKGRGCPECAYEAVSESRKVPVEDIAARLEARYGHLYEYDLTDYVDTNSKISITCKVHGKFKQKIHNHLRGLGCPKCSSRDCGYNTSKRGSIYILRCGDLIKVGITNVKVSSRAKQISKSYGKEFEVVTYMTFADGAIPDQTENQILRELKTQYEQPLEKFDGSTECFINACIPDIVKRIGTIASQHFN